MQINTYINKKEMFPLINPSAVFLVVGILQPPILGNINLEKLFYPIHLLHHPAYILKEGKKTSTGISKLNHQSIPKNDKKEPNSISFFDSSIPANHEASQEDETIPNQGVTLDTIAAYNDQAENNDESHRILVFDSLVPLEQEENQDSKNIPVQDLIIPTDNDKSYQNQESNRITVFDSSIPSEQEVNHINKIVPFQGFVIPTDNDKSYQNQESNRITVFDSSIPLMQEENQENKIVPVEGFIRDSENDKSNENQESNKITIFDSSIPTRYHEDQDLRNISVLRQTIDMRQGGNYYYRARSKHKLDRISVFDASVQRKKEEVEKSKEIPLHGPYIPKKDYNKIKPGIDLHHVSFSNSLLLKNEQKGEKEGTQDEDEYLRDEDREEKNETGKKSVVKQSFFKTFIRAPYKQANAQDILNKGLQRISVFDSNIMSKNNGEDEANMQDIHNPVIVQNHRHELQNLRKEFHRISVFDSTPFSPVSVPAIDQTLLRDRHSHENPEKGLRPIPISESSTPINGKYKSYIPDEDIPPKHGPKNKNKKKQKKKSKTKKHKLVIDSDTISKYGDELAHLQIDSTVADALTRKVRVLCWIMTFPANHATKAKHVKETWGKRCNKLLFMSTKNDYSLPTVVLPVVEGYNYLWGKTKAAFRYIQKHHFNDADWFLKADDDTYVIVENLRHMLTEHDTHDPVFFGFRNKDSFAPDQGYVHGGAGYVLSKEALNRFVRVALPSSELCKKEDTGMEDVEISKCLAQIDVSLEDSRDEYERDRFFPHTPDDHVDVKKDGSHYWEIMYYPMKTGLDCCSEYAISFHFVSENLMYVLEYFVYHLRLYGITYNFE